MSCAIGSVPRSLNRVFTVGSRSASCRPETSLSTTALGVPFGAYMPCQTATSKPLRPCSSSVGMSLSEATRVLVVTPYAWILPLLICAVVLVVWSHMKSTWPPSRSFIAGPVPLYGTVVRSVSIALMNSMPQRCEAEPIPALA